MQIPLWVRGGGLVLGVLLAPFWLGAAVANGGFLAFGQHAWAQADPVWRAAAGWPGPQGERLRLASVANGGQGRAARALDLAGQAVQAAPGAPLSLLQLGLMQQANAHALALDSWRRAGAAPYFCTQAATALYHTTPPDLPHAVEAATICTELTPGDGAGWLVLGQAQAVLGQDQAAVAAFLPAYTHLLEAGQPGRAAVAAATALGVARQGNAPADVVTAWRDRAHALAPTVCADPARPQDPNLDALCATP